MRSGNPGSSNRPTRRATDMVVPSVAADTPDGDVSSTDRVVNHITEGVLAGRYVPGQRLVEADLTRTLRVSRGPVREAFRRLDARRSRAHEHDRGAMRHCRA